LKAKQVDDITQKQDELFQQMNQEREKRSNLLEMLPVRSRRRK
jgi:hypothetical protein